MRPHAYKTTTVGLVITIALILAAFGILSVGREQGLFRDRVSFRTDFPNVDGLTSGSPVRLVGVQVGVVTEVRFPSDISKAEVEVRFAVDRSFRDRIREGTTATLKNLTYLSGEKYIELKPGHPDKPLISEDGYIESPRGEFEQFLVSSQTIAQNVEVISEQLRDLLEELNAGNSVLSQLIRDPAFGRKEIEQAGSSIERLNQVLTRIESGQGLVGRLLMDDAWAKSTLGAVAQSVDRLDAFTKKIDEGQGLIGQLTRPDSEAVATLHEVRESASSLRALVGRLESGEGLAGRLLMDKEYGATMSARLNAIAADLQSILNKVDRGEGTLGLLLNEPDLYDQAKNVVGGVSDSAFLRWVARRVRNAQVKKQIEGWAREMEAAEKQKPAAPPGSKP